jgi:thioredoxin 1
MGSVRVITDQEFDAEVLSATQPVLVYFWATWCGPCRLTAPLIEKIAEEYGDRIKVVKLEIDPNPESVAKYKVEGVPAFRCFQNGDLKKSAEGAINRQKLEELVTQNLLTV